MVNNVLIKNQFKIRKGVQAQHEGNAYHINEEYQKKHTEKVIELLRDKFKRCYNKKKN